MTVIHTEPHQRLVQLSQSDFDRKFTTETLRKDPNRDHRTYFEVYEDMCVRYAEDQWIIPAHIELKTGNIVASNEVLAQYGFEKMTQLDDAWYLVTPPEGWVVVMGSYTHASVSANYRFKGVVYFRHIHNRYMNSDTLHLV